MSAETLAGYALTATGRLRHDHKITVYLTADELHALDQALIELRYTHGLKADRGRIVREALWLVLEGLGQNGSRSWLVERLREIR